MPGPTCFLAYTAPRRRIVDPPLRIQIDDRDQHASLLDDELGKHGRERRYPHAALHARNGDDHPVIPLYRLSPSAPRRASVPFTPGCCSRAPLLTGLEHRGAETNGTQPARGGAFSTTKEKDPMRRLCDPRTFYDVSRHRPIKSFQRTCLRDLRVLCGGKTLAQEARISLIRYLRVFLANQRENLQGCPAHDACPTAEETFRVLDIKGFPGRPGRSVPAGGLRGC